MSIFVVVGLAAALIAAVVVAGIFLAKYRATREKYLPVISVADEVARLRAEVGVLESEREHHLSPMPIG
jgi:hypothetical protein